MNSSALYSSLYCLRAVNRLSCKFSASKALLVSYNGAISKEVSPVFMSSLQSKIKASSTNADHPVQKVHMDENKKESQPKVEKTLRKRSLSESRPTLNPKDSDVQFGIFINSAKSDPDNFGTLNEDWKMHQKLSMMPEEEEDVTETEYVNNIEGRRRLTNNQYAKIIKKFLKQKKLGLALEVLEKRMLKEDRALPEAYHYNLLITGCGQVGYVRKAFQLHKQMKVRGLKPTKHTYTSMFNACANSPSEFVEESLQRSVHLRAYLQERAFPLTPLIYHAMIKAFGRCGDVETAFLLVDEMLEKDFGVSDETFNFLLQACISDKAAGFRHALLVYWKMRQKLIKPNLFTFNLLLRCSRDCELGDDVTTRQVIQTILLSNQKSKKHLEIEEINNPAVQDQFEKVSDSQIVPTGLRETMPNLISATPSMGNIVAIKAVDKPEYRLMLMGGPRGVLEQMRFYNVKPDIKTFSQLLDQIPSTLEAEQELLKLLDEAKVTLNVDFCNMLMRKRCFRNDFDGAKDVLKLLQKHNLKLNLFTFGVLALACRDWPTAQDLLKNMDNSGFRPNIEILGTMLRVARFEKDCRYVMEIMKTLRKLDIQPDKRFIDQLNMFNSDARNCLSEKDYSEKLTRKEFDEYLRLYRNWKPRKNIEEPAHPWNQFREPVHEPEDLELLNRGRKKYAP